MASIDFDIEDFLDEAETNDLKEELSRRGINVSDDVGDLSDTEDLDMIKQLIRNSSNIDVDNLSLIISMNIETLFSKLSNIDQNEFEEFLNKY